MDAHTRFPLLLALILLFLSLATSDNSKDKEECEGLIVGLGTCLSYVGGNSKAPTPDCCSALKHVLETNKKCLCVVIKDRNDPDLGVKINVTLALGLPKVCNVPANNSKCPELLNLPPDSPDAQIFYPPANTTSHVKSNSTSAPAGANTPGSRAQQKSGGCGNGNRFPVLEIMGGLMLLWAFTENFIM
ncbi:hypothetical protein BUALT_Bualt01G0177800 [Buddleja alternifolia]|uniref:Bifunctional inhibitor/plant lipid transfer protein/seed storage helical domain-containing protein n=1 Tax=Buddleja alternifolia TaxID=168488 RepID=A0AAV6Y807_9LAMI|nr:hypothetical protein BUALT_Bualt01G0177800 [Buddleja alternifolia]